MTIIVTIITVLVSLSYIVPTKRQAASADKMQVTAAKERLPHAQCEAGASGVELRVVQRICKAAEPRTGGKKREKEDCVLCVKQGFGRFLLQRASRSSLPLCATFSEQGSKVTSETLLEQQALGAFHKAP